MSHPLADLKLMRSPGHRPEEPPRWYVKGSSGALYRQEPEVCWMLERHYNLDPPRRGKMQEILPQRREDPSLIGSLGMNTLSKALVVLLLVLAVVLGMALWVT